MLIGLVLTVPGAHESHGAQSDDVSPLYRRPGQRSTISKGQGPPGFSVSALPVPSRNST